MLSLLVLSICSKAQDTLQDSIQTIKISALKIDTDLKRSTLSVNAVKINQSNLQNLSLQDQISNIPGLISLNAYNFAQDLRISIRGFGARSPFGIRGIKLIVDGIPETTPDGLGQLDNLNLDLIEKIEIIKGPASGLYGNASGGVIKIDTKESNDNYLINGSYAIGSFGYQKMNLSLSKKINQTQILLNANQTKSDGYRFNSEFESNLFQLKVKHSLSPSLNINWNTSIVDSPLANDPGGINLDAVEEDRLQARPQNIQFK
ncbi:MAG: TonB-dependent receptor plug domain-containing protein, partial [Saprospiraceae bacterium]|nr:TonB-dependent receptor plug domain-containing protein [Saprospiraceae bacterium]